MIGLLLWMMIQGQGQITSVTATCPLSTTCIEVSNSTNWPWILPNGSSIAGQDVPAIQVEVLYEERGKCLRSGSDGCSVTDPDGKAVDASEWFHASNPNSYHLYRQSCDDKSRILLTSEDGKKHCLKLGN